VQVVYIAARDVNLVPEPVTFNSKKVDISYWTFIFTFRIAFVEGGHDTFFLPDIALL